MSTARWSNSLRMLVGLVILAGVCCLLYWVVAASAAFVAGLESDTAVAFVSSAAAIVGSAVTIALGKIYETRASIRSHLREKKTPIYESIVATLFRVMFAAKLKKEQLSEDELVAFFVKTTETLTIWGSDEVVAAFSRFRAQASENPKESIFVMEELLLAIRKDLGHKNKAMGRGSILRLFVTDIDIILKG